ncbi:histone H2A.Z-specific chaperone CHZ1 [Boeremia exigua]|uniref:histone H2A.Z-specific chaperone CHZ1 n=1 Tax=Boeremia exigua TaxID=749465 RepID=UPI001E8DE031|nr:histone H2A.Z-specific chaperone CHZ1 [Boeremia exigua]KAH6642716.1 histone H2A.Z-specific chaperone CHZ1 [Boeremia exigua]
MSAQQDQQMEGVQDNKGKGKAPQQDNLEESDDSSDESAGEEVAVEPEEADEDNMEEIETSNIIHGSRTRGKTIDFAKANEELGDDDEEDEDDDFVDPDDEMKD